MIRRIRAMIHKELHQILRDQRTLGLLLFVPAFLLVMFGYAISLDVEDAPIALVDHDHSPESRGLATVLRQSRFIDVRYHFDSAARLDGLFRSGMIKAAVVIPTAFGKSLIAGSATAAQLIIDGSDGTTGNTVLGYLRSIVTEYARLDAKGAAAVDFRPRVWFNPDLESNQFLIPGLVAFILIVTSVISTALSVVREKELGSMEQLAISPLTPMELILGKTLPYLVLSLLTAALIFLLSVLFFDMVVAGSLLLLVAVTILFLFASLGFGIFLSTVAETQQVAFLLAILTTFLPSFILSGFVFPIRNMPGIIQAVTYLVPARHYLSALRAIVLKGVGLGVVWPDVALLGAFAVVMVSFGSIRLRVRSFDS